MSFLNALASDGLSVGLRFYAARMNRAGEMAVNEAAGPEEAPQTERMAEAERLAKPAPPPPPPKEQTPEEMAAGRAEAQAMLASDASLGRLQAARGESDQAEAAKLFAGGEETADASVMNGEMAAAEQLAGAAQVAGEAEEPDAEEGEEGEDGKDKAGGEELTQEEEEEVQEMKKRDREVRTHELSDRAGRPEICRGRRGAHQQPRFFRSGTGPARR